MSEPIEYAYEDELTCPYCGDVQTDSWELDMNDEEEREHECPACENVYAATCHVSITYSTRPIAKAKGEGV